MKSRHPLLGERRPAFLFLLPALVVIALTTLYPLAYSLFLSGHSWNMSIPTSHPVPNFPTNYTALLSDPQFLSSVRTTFVFVGVSVVIELIIGMALAMLVTSSLRYLGLVRTMLLIPVMIAPVVVGILWRTLYHTDYGPINDVLGMVGLPGREWLGDPKNALLSVILVEVWQQTPVVTLILAAGLASIPVELGEAARVDGASGLRIFRHITLPLLRRVILVVLLLRIMDLFKTFDVVYTLTQGGPGGATDVISNLIYRTGLRAFQLGTSSAMSWVFLVIVVLVSLAFVRQVMRRDSAPVNRELGTSRLFSATRYLFTLAVIILAAFPLFWLVITSLKGQGEVATNPPIYIPTQITFENYQQVLASTGIAGNAINSVIVALVTTFITVVIGGMAAYALARRQLPHNFRHWLLIAVLIIRMFPPITTVIPYFVLLRGFGLTDTYAGLILTYVAYGLPFAIWLLVGFFQELPPEIEEAATMDGTTYIQRFRLIVLPLARPALAVTSVFVLIYAWNEFLFASILTSFNTKTLPVVMAGYISDKGIEWGQMSALGTMMVVPVILVAWMSQKHIVRGLTFGAVKE